MPSPVSDNHASPHFDIIGLLAAYRFATPGVQGGDNGTVRLDWENEPQPDAMLRILPQCGGKSRVDDDKYVAGPPELVAEVAVSSASYDLHDKLRGVPAERRVRVPGMACLGLGHRLVRAPRRPF